MGNYCSGTVTIKGDHNTLTLMNVLLNRLGDCASVSGFDGDEEWLPHIFTEEVTSEGVFCEGCRSNSPTELEVYIRVSRGDGEDFFKDMARNMCMEILWDYVDDYDNKEHQCHYMPDQKCTTPNWTLRSEESLDEEDDFTSGSGSAPAQGGSPRSPLLSKLDLFSTPTGPTMRSYSPAVSKPKFLGIPKCDDAKLADQIEQHLNAAVALYRVSSAATALIRSQCLANLYQAAYLVKQVADRLSDNPRVAESIEVYELNNTYSTLYGAFGVRAFDVTIGMPFNDRHPLALTRVMFDGIVGAAVMLFAETYSTRFSKIQWPSA